jgi:hypothetical protein
MLQLGLVDSVEVAIIAVLPGGGVQFLPAPVERAKLLLVRHRVYEKTGTVSLEYTVCMGQSRKKRREHCDGHADPLSAWTVKTPHWRGSFSSPDNMMGYALNATPAEAFTPTINRRTC